jgi:hypothetical protein
MDPAAMRQAYIRLGFTQAAALSITDGQDIDSIAELRILKNDEIENLCKVIRCPGGTIPNPNAGDGQPPAIPNPGIPVSLRAENNLKLAAYWLHHRVRVARDVEQADITLANIRSVRELRDSEEEYKAPKDLPTLNEKDWPKTMEAIHEFLRMYLGESKIPLAYIVRDEEALPDGNDPAINYATVQDEMIRRAPHDGQMYQSDNEKTWEIMAAITRDHDCWTYVKPAQRARDGRQAYQRLFNHYLGPNNVDNLASAAEKRLETTTYQGEKKRWDFEKYVRVHVEQHSILEGLVEHGYSGIDARSKVRHLLNGIKTDQLNAVKTQIMSSATLRNDFTACVTLYQDFIRQVKSSGDNPTLNISSVNTLNHASRKRKHGDDEVEDRYYTKQEYSELTQEQKDTLRQKRKKRKGGKGGQSGQSKGIEKVHRTIAALSARIDKMSATSKSATEDAEGDSEEPVTNRNNKALTCQKSGKK